MRNRKREKRYEGERRERETHLEAECSEVARCSISQIANVDGGNESKVVVGRERGVRPVALPERVVLRSDRLGSRDWQGEGEEVEGGEDEEIGEGRGKRWREERIIMMSFVNAIHNLNIKGRGKGEREVQGATF